MKFWSSYTQVNSQQKLKGSKGKFKSPFSTCIFFFLKIYLAIYSHIRLSILQSSPPQLSDTTGLCLNCYNSGVGSKKKVREVVRLTYIVSCLIEIRFMLPLVQKVLNEFSHVLLHVVVVYSMKLSLVLVTCSFVGHFASWLMQKTQT